MRVSAVTRRSMPVTNNQSVDQAAHRRPATSQTTREGCSQRATWNDRQPGTSEQQLAFNSWFDAAGLRRIFRTQLTGWMAAPFWSVPWTNGRRALFVSYSHPLVIWTLSLSPSPLPALQPNLIPVPPPSPSLKYTSHPAASHPPRYACNILQPPPTIAT